MKRLLNELPMDLIAEETLVNARSHEGATALTFMMLAAHGCAAAPSLSLVQKALWVP